MQIAFYSICFHHSGGILAIVRYSVYAYVRSVMMSYLWGCPSGLWETISMMAAANYSPGCPHPTACRSNTMSRS